jgi:hypothetical protein
MGPYQYHRDTQAHHGYCLAHVVTSIWGHETDL